MYDFHHIGHLTEFGPRETKGDGMNRNEMGSYYWPAGHTGWTDEGVTFIEISPVSEIREVMDHLATKMAG